MGAAGLGGAQVVAAIGGAQLDEHALRRGRRRPPRAAIVNTIRNIYINKRTGYERGSSFGICFTTLASVPAKLSVTGIRS